MDTAVRPTPVFEPGFFGRLAGALALAFFGAFAVFHLLRDGFFPLAAMVSAIAIFAILILLKKSLSPWRWLATGIVLAVLFTIFPIFYTVYLSFTNMGPGHLVTKEQAITRITQELYVPEDATLYSWEAYQKGDAWLLLLTDGEGRQFTVQAGQDPVPLGGEPLAEAPAELQGFTLLDPVMKIQMVQDLTTLAFGTEENPIRIADFGTAGVSKHRFSYDATTDTVTEIATGTTFTAVKGTFTSASGEEIVPGFIVPVGLENYASFLGTPGYFKPIVQMVIWNVLFSLISVTISFGLGLLIALLFEGLPGQRLIRALLIIPYPIPVLVSLMVWRGLLNEKMGLVTNLLNSVFGVAPAFFTDPFWAQFSVILINVYLSYPYFFILCAGALKSIPTDLYEAAEIDGANQTTVLRRITLPMVLRILTPLLIASYSFNFNNFTVIWGFNAGLPAMADTIVPMGHTDLLISFIYRLGFNASNAADYGFSAAVTVLLFAFVGIMVWFQTRKAQSLKETS